MLAQSVAVEVNASDVEPVTLPRFAPAAEGLESAPAAHMGRPLAQIADLGLANG